MDATREVTITGRARVDFEVGDAVYIFYQNSEANPTDIGVSFSKPPTSGNEGRVVHGAAITNAKSGELMTVRLAFAGTLGIKVNWTGNLTPGTLLYPPAESADSLSAIPGAFRTNALGFYVGKDIHPESVSGQICEVLIVRVGPDYSVV